MYTDNNDRPYVPRRIRRQTLCSSHMGRPWFPTLLGARVVYKLYYQVVRLYRPFGCFFVLGVWRLTRAAQRGVPYVRTDLVILGDSVG